MMLFIGIVLLHNNTIRYHSPYSSDLAPSGYHLFMHIKKRLPLQQFETDELQTDVNRLSQDAGGRHL